MKYSVMYCSKTENTKQLAEVIAKTLQSEELIYVGEPSQKGFDADILCIGSWIDKGSFDSMILDQIKMFENKKIFVFATAGFGGSPQYFQVLLNRFVGVLPKSTQILGSFMCQGKMPISVRMRYEAMLEKNPNDEKILNFLRNFEQASTHPDKQDIENLTTCMKDVLHIV